MELFENIGKVSDNKVNCLWVDSGSFKELDVTDLFKKSKHIKAITYSTSLNAIISLLKNAEQVDLIVGLEVSYDLANTAVEILKKLETAGIQLMKKDFSIRFAENTHTKLFILYSDNFKYAIFGSANLSNSAITGKQNEVIVITDNEEIIEQFEDYFEKIKKSSKDVLDKESIKDVLKETNKNLYINIETENLIINEKFRKEFQEAAITVMAKNMIDLSSANLPKVKKQMENMKIGVNFLENINKNKKSIELYKNDYKKLKKTISELSTEIENVLIPKKISVQDGEIFYEGISVKDLEINETKLNEAKESIKNFIELSSYSSNDHPLLLGEAIVYSFASPLMYFVREKAKYEGYDLNKFPIFLLLVGTAKAGKTTILKFLGKLLDEDVVRYRNIETKGNSKVPTIESRMMIDDFSPILIDEINPSHLKDSSALGELIKSSTESNYYYRSIILTSNLSEFSGELQIVRRSCFLPFKYQVKENNKDVANLIKQANSNLFLKFLKSIDIKNLNINPDDPIYFAREFLINEGINVPENYIGNYYRAILQGWKEFFIANASLFEEIEGIHKNTGKVVKLFKVPKELTGFLFPLETFENGGDAQHYFLLKDEFLKTIKYKNPNPTFLDRIKSVFKK